MQEKCGCGLQSETTGIHARMHRRQGTSRGDRHPMKRARRASEEPTGRRLFLQLQRLLQRIRAHDLGLQGGTALLLAVCCCEWFVCDPETCGSKGAGVRGGPFLAVRLRSKPRCLLPLPRRRECGERAGIVKKAVNPKSAYVHMPAWQRRHGHDQRMLQRDFFFSFLCVTVPSRCSRIMRTTV